MIFKEGQAIFIQIAERICDEILAGKYEADARIPGCATIPSHWR